MIDHLNTSKAEHSLDRKFGSTRKPDEVYPSGFGGSVRAMEAIPVNVSGELVLSDKPTVVYAHGSASYGQIEPTIEAIAEYGYDAIALEFQGERKPDSSFSVGSVQTDGSIDFNDVSNKQMKELLNDTSKRPDVILPKQQLQDALSMLEVLAERRNKGVDDGPVDFVAQSASAAVAIIAAYLDSDPNNTSPRLLNEIVLAFPGGIIGPQGNPTKRILKDALARRAFKPESENDFRPGKRISAGKAAIKQAQTPGFRADGAALRYGSLAPVLHAIAVRPDGPRVTIVAGEQDQIFRPSEIVATLVSSDDAEVVTVPTSHGIGGRRDTLETILRQL